MHEDVRSKLNRLAPMPRRQLDLAALITEGRRRRRRRYSAYAAVALVMGSLGLTLIPSIVDRAGGRNEQRVAAPVRPGAAEFREGWTQLPPPPEVRTGPAAVWTGQDLLVWGGYVYTGYSDEAPSANGFSWNAANEKWTSLPQSPLGARSFPATVWTGAELLLWGGWDGLGAFFGDGAAFNPETARWRSLPASPLGPRAALSVWTGSELLLWGTSIRMDHPPRDGAAYDPASNTWRSIPPAPVELTDASAVWSGEEMFVFGASLGRNNEAATESAIGAAYDPLTNEWRELPVSKLFPQATAAAWDGREMIAWDHRSESAAYDPDSDSWRTLPRVPLETVDCSPEAVSLGDAVFGHFCGESVVLERESSRWRDVSHDDVLGSGATLVPGDGSVFLMVRSVETEEESMLVYRAEE